MRIGKGMLPMSLSTADIVARFQIAGEGRVLRCVTGGGVAFLLRTDNTAKMELLLGEVH